MRVIGSIVIVWAMGFGLDSEGNCAGRDVTRFTKVRFYLVSLDLIFICGLHFLKHSFAILLPHFGLSLPPGVSRQVVDRAATQADRPSAPFECFAASV